MDDSKLNNTAENAKKGQPLIAKVLNPIAYPLATIIGWFWTNRSARNSLYDDVKHADSFRQFREGTKNIASGAGVTDPATLIAAAREGKMIEVGGGGHWGKNSTLTNNAFITKTPVGKALREERRVFDKITSSYFKAIGYKKPVNTLAYLRDIHPEEAIKAIMAGFGAGGVTLVTLGAVVSLASHKTLQSLFAEKEKKQDQGISLN